MKKLAISLFCIFLANSAFSLDAASNGGWISVGVPSFIHIGTDGKFYLNGSDQGSCGSVKPQYMRLDMGATHFKEFYSWLLFMSAQKKAIACTVSHGCGQNEVWTTYCRGSLE
jgi:hypothetical protein